MKYLVQVMILKGRVLLEWLRCELLWANAGRPGWTFQRWLGSPAGEGSECGVHQGWRWEQFVPSDHHAGQIEFFQQDLSNTHKAFMVHPAIVPPDNHLQKHRNAVTLEFLSLSHWESWKKLSGKSGKNYWRRGNEYNEHQGGGKDKKILTFKVHKETLDMNS